MQSPLPFLAWYALLRTCICSAFGSSLSISRQRYLQKGAAREQQQQTSYESCALLSLYVASCNKIDRYPCQQCPDRRSQTKHNQVRPRLSLRETLLQQHGRQAERGRSLVDHERQEHDKPRRRLRYETRCRQRDPICRRMDDKADCRCRALCTSTSAAILLARDGFAAVGRGPVRSLGQIRKRDVQRLRLRLRCRVLGQLVDEEHHDEADDECEPDPGVRLAESCAAAAAAAVVQLVVVRVADPVRVRAVCHGAVERLDSFGDDDDEAAADEETGTDGGDGAGMVLGQAEGEWE